MRKNSPPICTVHPHIHTLICTVHLHIHTLICTVHTHIHTCNKTMDGVVLCGAHTWRSEVSESNVDGIVTILTDLEGSEGWEEGR